MDAMQILIYTLAALGRGQVPYVEDVIGSRAVVETYGVQALMVLLPGWMLQASLFVSCALLLRRSRWGLYVAYVQIPFRLLLVMPSVPLALALVQRLDASPAATAMVVGSLLLLIELLKMTTLRRAVPMPPSNAHPGTAA